MRSLGAAHLVVLVVLVLDSRRLRALARARGLGRRGPSRRSGIPAGAHPDQVGLPLRQIQMRTHVDWEDGGAGRDGPEILPADEPGDRAHRPTPTLPSDSPGVVVAG